MRLLLNTAGAIDPWTHLLTAGTLVMIRVGGVFVFAPPFNSPAISAQVKAGFLFALVFLLTPAAAGLPNTDARMDASAILGEVAVGLLFGFTLSLLNEALLFAGSLLGMSFSFSLANLMDPNSRVDTPVLGTLLNWLGILIVFGAGFDRALLAAVIRSLAVVPLGHAAMHINAAHQATAMVAGIFLAGLQLAAPIMAATIVVEVTVALVSRLAPALPAQVIGVPIKTIVSYIVLIGAIGIWPAWIGRHFTALLDVAQHMMTA